MNKENYTACFTANLDGVSYIIPSHLRDRFDGTSYYDRETVFENYIVPEGAIIETILVDEYDLKCLIDGDFD